jgi:hypothetical protein
MMQHCNNSSNNNGCLGSASSSNCLLLSDCESLLAASPLPTMSPSCLALEAFPVDKGGSCDAPLMSSTVSVSAHHFGMPATAAGAAVGIASASSCNMDSIAAAAAAAAGAGAGCGGNSSASMQQEDEDEFVCSLLQLPAGQSSDCVDLLAAGAQHSPMLF